MYPQSEPAYAGTSLQKQREGIAAIRRMGCRRQSFDVVLRARAVGPLISVSPESKLEIQAARRRLLDDETERLQITLPFAVVQRYGADLAPGNIDQIRVGKMQIIAGDAPREIVAPAEGEAEAIESIRDEVRKVVAPIVAVVEPALILDIADECAVDASDAVSGRSSRGAASVSAATGFVA